MLRISLPSPRGPRTTEAFGRASAWAVGTPPPVAAMMRLTGHYRLVSVPSMTSQPVEVARIYGSDGDGHGARILVDRLWPRGVSKAAARLDEWCKAVAPSNELREWYGHDPDKYDEFVQRYRQELTDPDRATALDSLRQWHERGPVTLLTATKQADISHAAVLAGILRAG